jgi:hypothetical protein
MPTTTVYDNCDCCAAGEGDFCFCTFCNGSLPEKWIWHGSGFGSSPECEDIPCLSFFNGDIDLNADFHFPHCPSYSSDLIATCEDTDYYIGLTCCSDSFDGFPIWYLVVSVVIGDSGGPVATWYSLDGGTPLFNCTGTNTTGDGDSGANLIKTSGFACMGDVYLTSNGLNDPQLICPEEMALVKPRLIRKPSVPPRPKGKCCGKN